MVQILTKWFNQHLPTKDSYPEHFQEQIQRLIYEKTGSNMPLDKNMPISEMYKILRNYDDSREEEIRNRQLAETNPTRYNINDLEECYWLQRMDRLLKWEKQRLGITGSPPISTTRGASKKNIAKSFVQQEECFLAGYCVKLATTTP